MSESSEQFELKRLERLEHFATVKSLKPALTIVEL
jgi:hypothetical protein